MKKRMRTMMVVLMSVMSLVVLAGVCGAVEIPANLTRDDALSQNALNAAKAQFEVLKTQLNVMMQGAEEDQKALLTQTITMVEERLNRLERIDVYRAQEDAMGDAYDSVLTFYQGKLGMLQSVGSEELQFAVMQAPEGLIPEETLNAFMALTDEGKVKASTGTSGKSRVSILTVYLNPATFELIEGTTVVVSTDK